MAGFQGQRSGVEEVYTGNSTSRVPLGISCRTWLSIVSALRVPHFSFTKRLGLQHETDLPVIYDEYFSPRVIKFQWLLQDPRPCRLKRTSTHICPECFEDVYLHNERLGVLVCEHCGSHAPYHVSFSYRQSNRSRILPRLYSNDFYKRCVHFRYWLLRLQAKERSQIQGSDVDVLRRYLDATRMTPDYWNIKRAMKACHMQKYYDHVVSVMKELTGYPLLMMTPMQEKTLVKRFMGLQRVYSQIRQERVNMMSYPYLIKKFCELEGWYSAANVIPTLKSQIRIQQQDRIWYYICKVSRFSFTPTGPSLAVENH